MRSAARIFLKITLSVLSLLCSYVLIAFILSFIPVSEKYTSELKLHTIYLTTNGVHADLILPKSLIDSRILRGQKFRRSDRYFAFGWGEEEFYLHTPTWKDLRLSTALRAAFLKNKTLVHVTRYRQGRDSWIPIKVTEGQLEKLNHYVLQTFNRSGGFVQLIDNATYTLHRDNFYKAHGHYSFYRTCNTWLNRGLKNSGMKGSLWTPFDFGVLRWYEK